MPTTVAEVPLTAGIEHGTRDTYQDHKCRCALCRSANARYMRELRASKNVPYPARVAIALSVLNHREPTEETCRLAIRALRGFDVIAEAAG